MFYPTALTLIHITTIAIPAAAMVWALYHIFVMPPARGGRR